MINVPERFAGELAGGVRRDGTEDGVGLAEGNLGEPFIDEKNGEWDEGEPGTEFNASPSIIDGVGLTEGDFGIHAVNG